MKVISMIVQTYQFSERKNYNIEKFKKGHADMENLNENELATHQLFYQESINTPSAYNYQNL